jgi:thiol-disulfide isomerase/thioredoxin
MEPQTTRRLGLALALVVIAGVILAIEKPWAPDPSAAPPPPANLSAEELAFPAAPDFGAATGWLGSAPLKIADLRGHVVLVDFWTYSCINCIHTFPHVEGYYERYKADGLVVVGVHTPEFGFERDPANIAAARERYNLTYPTAIDSDYGVWNAYGNRYWPAEYLIDAHGRVRDTHFGEGGYDQTEASIRALLTEAGHPPKAPPGEAAANATGEDGITPELYASAAEGADRVAIANPEGYHEGQDVTYAEPE